MTAYTSILRSLPICELPAYRVETQAEGCGLAELLAAVIGGERQVENAQALIKEFSDIQGIFTAPVAALESIPGITHLTAVRIKAALSLGKKLLQSDPPPTIHDPKDIYNLIRPRTVGMIQEALWVICLNTRNGVILVSQVYQGCVNRSLIRVAELFRDAIKINAPALIIVHNHPSGDPFPSQEDIALTREVFSAAETLDIDVLDHLIIGSDSYVSLKERCLFPSPSSHRA